MPVDIIFYGIVVIILIINLLYYKKCKRPFLSILYGVITGLLFLFTSSYILNYMGYNLIVNYTTITFSAILGIPGVILMIILLII